MIQKIISEIEKELNLEISQIQKPGGKPISIEEYLNAHSFIGVTFVD